MTAGQKLRVSFLGGAGEIGASCALVQAGDTNLLVDCGVRFHGGDALPDLASLGNVRLDAVLVTHAHSDHSGGLPVVADTFPGTPVYATPPTIDLTMILLRDALKLMGTPEFEGEYPLFSGVQLERLQDSLRPVTFDTPLEIGDVRITFHPASHILGAAMIHLETLAGGVLFTGDYSVSPQNTVPALPRPALRADLVVTESTYGNRLHENRATAEERLLGRIGRVVETGGRVLIPAFAVGRAQEVLLILKRGLRRGTLPQVPVFVDGMVRAVCDVYRRHGRYVSRSLAHAIRRDEHPFYTQGIRPVEKPEDRRRVLDAGACVIVASSGMLVGGASTVYASALAGNPQDAILITGYQDEESPGRALLDLAEKEGPRKIVLGGESVDVRCRFDTYGLSAHADRMQMIAFLETLRPLTVVLVHGDREAKESLAAGLSCRDVVSAGNGMEIERSYRGVRSRREGARRKPSRVADLDITAARNLLGPPGDVPLRAREAVQAWFGERVDRDVVERFTGRLVSAGLVRRDDRRPSLLWVLGPGESDLFPEEAALAEELKIENPKGRLLELCTRLRTEPPEVGCDVSGGFHVVSMAIEAGGERLESGPQRAAARKTAEQLAAKALLERYRERLPPSDDVVRIDENEKTELREGNFKGRLLEWSTGRRIQPTPAFERRIVPGGFHIRAKTGLPGGDTVTSRWFGAESEKTAEQAAARDLLDIISRHQGSETAGDIRAENDPAAEKDVRNGAGSADTPDPDRGMPDPRPLLNTLRQTGVIRDFGYTLHDQRGAPHRPIFVMTGWALTAGDERIETDPVEAGSRRTAQREAASALVARLRRAGFLAEPPVDQGDRPG